MLLSQDANSGQFTITAYEPGRIEVNKVSYQQPILLFANTLLTEALPESASLISVSLLETWIEKKADVIIVGVGAKSGIPPIALMKAAAKANQVIEFMDTRSACHTFVVLSSEKRNVMAVLFP